MDNCDLEKLYVSGGKLCPNFCPEVTDYRVTVESSVTTVTLELLTSDCGASCHVLSGDGTRTVKLTDGPNRVEMEVVAENGSTKKYYVEITKLSEKIAELSDLKLEGDLQLQPVFSGRVYEYHCLVPFHREAVTLVPRVPDKNIKVSVNGAETSRPVQLNYGDTMVDISVCSADGTNSQVYSVLVTRDLLPVAVIFTDVKQQLDFECPVSLSAFYRPVSIKHSEPKHTFSRPFIEMLARRSRVDPLSDRPLGDGWKISELEVERNMSAALVKCLFHYRGCEGVMRLRELGSHSLHCPHRPSGDLDPKEVKETSWYQSLFGSSSSFEIKTKHKMEIRHWEKKLQASTKEFSVEKLCALSQDQLRLYRQHLDKQGTWLQREDDQSPLHCLEQAAAHYATAIRLSRREARLHFLLGLVLEEQHQATEMFGLRKKVKVMKLHRDRDEFSDGRSAAYQDEILAVCKLHGFLGIPTVEVQLQALDKEYQHLKEQGQSSKADYIQTLYVWLSKKTGTDRSPAVWDEENQSVLHRALLKYLDAWSLSPDSWEYNLHVGRLLLLQDRSREALQHLQRGLALRPLHPALRFFTGLALLQQEEITSEETQKEAALFLHQGLEHFISQHCSHSSVKDDLSETLSCVNTQFLRGLLTLGELLQKTTVSGRVMGPQQVYHMAAVLAAQGVSRCLCRGEASRQLEWVLLDAHFALLQSAVQHKSKNGAELLPLVSKRCQGLSALIRHTSITACQKLLDMQERTCQLAVVTTPRDSYALCLLGLAQLAQYDNNNGPSERSRSALVDARLSFQASIELENKSQEGEALPQLNKQKWWQEQQEVAKRSISTKPTTASKTPPDSTVAKRGSRRGRPEGGPTAVVKTSRPSAPSASSRGGKTVRPVPRIPASSRGRSGAAASDRPSRGSKPQSSANTSKQAVTAEGSPVGGALTPSAPLNRTSHVSRLGLARILSRSIDSQEEAKQLYREVLSMAPGVHDAYVELVQLLEPSDPLAAVEVYCRFPLKPVVEQNFDDAFITGEIVRMLMSLEEFHHPQLGPCLAAYGRVMGLSSIEKYISVLEEASMTNLLKNVYARIHDRHEDDLDLQDFFRFKCWI